MSKVSADSVSNKDNTLEVPTETVVQGSAKAWVNFKGTGTVAINDSFNVSSILDNGVGDYTVNFTNAMTNADYSATVTADGSTVTAGTTDHNQNTVSSVLVQSFVISTGVPDDSRMSVSIHSK